MYPVYTTQGHGGVIHIMDGFYPDRPHLNEKEIDFLSKILPGLADEDRKIMSEILKKYGGKKK